MKYFPILLIGLCLLLASCNDGDIEDLDVDLIENTPVLSNDSNAFSYVLRADDFSQQINSSLYFNSASFVMSLIVAEYSQGMCLLSVYNEDSSQVYQQRITSSMVLTDSLVFKPSALELTLSSFSGNINVVLAVQ